jgi:hypothetical protein
MQGGETTAQFPLGSAFFLELADANLVPIESRFTLEAAQVEDILGDTLFHNHVVIAFDRATPSTIRYFQAVHRGSVVVNITPTDSSINPVRARIEVAAPARLESAT